MFNCCNNSTRCNCNRYIPNCSWYTYPQSSFLYPSIRFQNNNSISQTIGYFTAPAATVAAAGVIPVSLNRIIGTSQAITSNGSGVVLQPGVYLVNYSATASGEDGASIAVALNGTILPQLSQSSATASVNQNVANSGIITVSAPNSVLTLVNNSTATLTLANANLIITKLS